MKKAKSVDEYIKNTPKDYKKIIIEICSLVKKLAPNAKERISYGMPFYEENGRLVYFAAMNGYVGLYIPPPIIENHSKELQKYITTKSAIHLPLRKLPILLITKLIKARLKYNKLKNQK